MYVVSLVVRSQVRRVTSTPDCNTCEKYCNALPILSRDAFRSMPFLCVPRCFCLLKCQRQGLLTHTHTTISRSRDHRFSHWLTCIVVGDVLAVHDHLCCGLMYPTVVHGHKHRVTTGKAISPLFREWLWLKPFCTLRLQYSNCWSHSSRDTPPPRCPHSSGREAFCRGRGWG